jgi:hypothetical protein
MERTAKINMIVGLVGAAIFLTGLGFSVWNEQRAQELREHGVQVEARIVGTERERKRNRGESDEAYNYYWHVEFEHPEQGAVK